MNTKDKLRKKCDEVKSIIIDKNEAYGDSAIIPSKIFSKISATEDWKERSDEKLNRMQNKSNYVNKEKKSREIAR